MVFIRDDGTFDAPIDRIWKYLMDQEGHHRHETILAMAPIEQRGNQARIKVTSRGPDGKPYDETWLMTFFPPDGTMLEIVEGPGKGTKQTHTYIPDGKRTRVVVSGDFKIAGLDDETTRKVVLDSLERIFNEDNAALQEFR